MTEKRIQELREMLERGIIQKRHIEEMLKDLESNNSMMSEFNRIASVGGK